MYNDKLIKVLLDLQPILFNNKSIPSSIPLDLLEGLSDIETNAFDLISLTQKESLVPCEQVHTNNTQISLNDIIDNIFSSSILYEGYNNVITESK